MYIPQKRADDSHKNKVFIIVCSGHLRSSRLQAPGSRVSYADSAFLVCIVHYFRDCPMRGHLLPLQISPPASLRAQIYPRELPQAEMEAMATRDCLVRASSKSNECKYQPR